MLPQRHLQPPPPLSFKREIQFTKGRMWLNESYCWLVAFIGTLISYYCSPDVGKKGGVHWRGKDQSQGIGEWRKWSENEGAATEENESQAVK